MDFHNLVRLSQILEEETRPHLVLKVNVCRRQLKSDKLSVKLGLVRWIKQSRFFGSLDTIVLGVRQLPSSTIYVRVDCK